MKKISTYITKKVAEKLEELFKKDREAYEKNWDDIRVFIEYGMMSDPKFYERAEKFFLFKDTDDKYYTIEEYKALIKENQTDKNKALVYLYATDKDDQYTNIENAKAKGYNVLMMDGILDPHFISAYEQKEGEKGDDNRAMFARVDSNTIDKLIVKDDKEAASGQGEVQCGVQQRRCRSRARGGHPKRVDAPYEGDGADGRRPDVVLRLDARQLHADAQHEQPRHHWLTR